MEPAGGILKGAIMQEFSVNLLARSNQGVAAPHTPRPQPTTHINLKTEKHDLSMELFSLLEILIEITILSSAKNFG